MKHLTVIIVIICLFLLSWWLWKTSPEKEEETVPKPKLVIEGGEIVGMYEGRRSFVLKAERFTARTETTATIDGKIEGSVFDEKGDLIVSFEGIGGEVNLVNNDFKIYSKGKIKGKDFEVLADSLNWENRNSIFEANGNIEVRISSYRARCSNIRADFIAQKIELSGNPVLEF
ncbi:MAG: hypothetical protein N2380_01610 [bacterium]|nr:hypothetical protein [bacterium]